MEVLSPPGSGTSRAVSQISTISKPPLCLVGDENPADINLPRAHPKRSHENPAGANKNRADFSPN